MKQTNKVKLSSLLGLALIFGSAAQAAPTRWHDVIECEDAGKNKYHIKSSYDRGQLPKINQRYVARGQGALIEISSVDAQIPGHSSLETELDVQLSRTNSFLSFWVEIATANGQTVIRRFENDRAEIWRYVLSADPQAASPSGAPATPANLKGGQWERAELSCKPQ